MKTLADNLYFKNLDNNAGVFHHLIDAAEEEECKEAVLAYYFLVIADEALSKEQLDERIEAWFLKTFKVDIDFEIEDALNKLIRFGIVTSSHCENEQVEDKHSDMLVYKAVPMTQAQCVLDSKWDALFTPSS